VCVCVSVSECVRRARNIILCLCVIFEVEVFIVLALQSEVCSMLSTRYGVIEVTATIIINFISPNLSQHREMEEALTVKQTLLIVG